MNRLAGGFSTAPAGPSNNEKQSSAPGCQKIPAVKDCKAGTFTRERALQRKRRERQDYIVAIHEAGHVVARWHFAHAIDQASIIQGDSAAGYVCGLGRNEATHASARHFLEESIVIDLAGPAAQRRFAPKSRVHQSATADVEHATRCASLLCDTHDAQKALLRYAEIRARDIIEKHWNAVLAIADALLARYCLSGEECFSICNRAALTGAARPPRTARATSEPPLPRVQHHHLADTLLQVWVDRIASGQGNADEHQDVLYRMSTRMAGNYQPDDIPARMGAMIEDRRRRAQWRVIKANTKEG